MKKLLLFFSEVKKELFERTNWPTRDEVLNMTSFVVFSLIVVSIFLFFVDYYSNALIRYIVVGNVDFFKEYLEWIIEPIYGIPWRFVFFIVLVILFFYVLGKIKRGFR